MQKAYFNNAELENRKEQLLAQTNHVIESARMAEIPIMNVTTVHQPDRSTWTLNMLADDEGYLFEGEADAELVDRLNMEAVTSLTKTRDSAFFETILASRLRGLGVTHLILAGISTHGCILQTAADAYGHNFQVILAADAIATHDPRFHNTTLSLLEQEYRQRALTNGQIRELLA